MLDFLTPLLLTLGRAYIVPDYLLEFEEPPHLAAGRPVSTQYYCRWVEKTSQVMVHHRQAGFPKEVVIEKFLALQPHEVTKNSLLAVLDVAYDSLTDEMIQEVENRGYASSLAYQVTENSLENCMRKVDAGRARLMTNPDDISAAGKDFYRTVVMP